MRVEDRTLIIVLVVLILALTVGSALAQPGAEPPEWSTELFENLEDMATEYNDRNGINTNILETWLLRNARINLIGACLNA